MLNVPSAVVSLSSRIIPSIQPISSPDSFKYQSNKLDEALFIL